MGAFVEIDGVVRGYTSGYGDFRTSYDLVNGGSVMPPGNWGYANANLLDLSQAASDPSSSCVTANDPTCFGMIHVEFDGDWMAAGECGVTVPSCDKSTWNYQTTVTTSSLIDVQGFAYWDPSHWNEQGHNFNGWELHPLTAWKVDTSPPPPPGQPPSQPNGQTGGICILCAITQLFSTSSLLGRGLCVGMALSVSVFLARYPGQNQGRQRCLEGKKAVGILPWNLSRMAQAKGVNQSR